MKIYKNELQSLLAEANPEQPVYMLDTLLRSELNLEIRINITAFKKDGNVLHLPYVFYNGFPLNGEQLTSKQVELDKVFIKIEEDILDAGFTTSDGMINEEVIPSQTW